VTKRFDLGCVSLHDRITFCGGARRVATSFYGAHRAGGVPSPSALFFLHYDWWNAQADTSPPTGLHGVRIGLSAAQASAKERETGTLRTGRWDCDVTTAYKMH